MNSAEQKDFEYITPTEEEINDTVAAVSEILSSPEIVHSENKDLLEGYEEAKRLLISRNNRYEEINPALASTKGKAVAVLAINYLNGECSRAVLTGLFHK